MMASRALFTAALGGMLSLPSMCNVYHSDVGKLCDSEQLSQSSLKADRPQLHSWMERHVTSSPAVVLVRELEGKSLRGLSDELRDEARKAGLTSCALADQAEMLAKDEDVHADMVNLCAGSATTSDGSMARLDVVSYDDAERMREISAWAQANAKSPDTTAVVTKLAAAAPRQRGTVLRAEAGRVGVTACALASTLDTLPPAPAPVLARQAYASFMLMKVDGAAKNQLPVVNAVTGRDTAAALNGCYELALAGKPTLAGKVALRFSIDPGGQIIKAEDDGSSVPATLVQCMTTALHGLSLGVPLPDGGKDGARVSVTLQLIPVRTPTDMGAGVDPPLAQKLAVAAAKAAGASATPSPGGSRGGPRRR